MKMVGRRAALVGMAAALIASGAAAQTGAKSFEAGKLFKYLGLYYRIPAQERSLFKLSYFVETQGAPVSAVKLSTAAGPMPLAADGEVLRLPTAEQLRRKEQITIQAPKGTKFGLDLQLESLARPSTEMEAAPLVASVVQANKGIKGAVGLIGFAVPSMGRLEFKNAGSGQAVMADGRRLPLASVAGTPVFDVATPNVRTIVLTRAPSHIFMAPAPKPKKK
jgi:hypothetical protein